MIEKQFVGLRQDEAYRRHRRLRPDVVVRRLDGHTSRATPGAGAALDRRLDVHGHPQHVGCRISLRVHPRHVVEDGVSVGDFLGG